MGSSTVKRRVAGLLAVGLGAVAIGVGGTSTALGASCSDIGAITDIKAKNVSCKKAKTVISGWATGTDLKGFTCSDGSGKVTCRKGDAVIKFQA